MNPTLFLDRSAGALGHLPWSVAALALRVFPASVFFASGRTKVEGWNIADSTRTRYGNSYGNHIKPASLQTPGHEIDKICFVINN